MTGSLARGYGPGGALNWVRPGRKPDFHVFPASVVVAQPMFEAPPSLKRPLWNAVTSVEPKPKLSGSTCAWCWLLAFR